MSELLDVLRSRVDRARGAIGRVTPVPLLVRGGVFLATLAAFLVALPPGAPWPVSPVGAGLILAMMPAVAPRSRWVTLIALVAVAGWLLSTPWSGGPLPVARLLMLAGALYLMHTLAALAAVLRYDTVVAPEAVARWLGRAVLVVAGSAVLIVVMLAVARHSPSGVHPAALLVGLAVAVGLVALVPWLLRRP